MSVAMNHDGRLEVFVRGDDDQLWHCWQREPAAGPWSAWEQLGGVNLASGPAALLWRLEAYVEDMVVLAVGRDRVLWYRYRRNGTWGAWQSRGGFFTADTPVPAFQGFAGQAQVFLRDADGGVWSVQNTDDAAWGDPVFHGGSTVGPVGAGHHADGRTELLAQAADGTLQHRGMQSAVAWSNWTYLTGPIVAAPPALVLGQDGRMEGVFIGLGGEIRHLRQTAPGAGWAIQGALGGHAAGPAVISRNGNGRLEVIHVDADGIVHNNWQTTPNGPWIGPHAMDVPRLDPGKRICLARNADRRLELFGIDNSGTVVHAWQSEPSSGPWKWGALGRPGHGAAELGFRDAWYPKNHFDE